MTSTKSGSKSDSFTVGELLERRTRIQSWLDNLETVGAEANSRVVERVRADYVGRLEAVLEELGEHLEVIRADRESRQEELASATRRLEAATEELEETRLRHMIGEITDTEWRDRQPDLGDAVTEAEADRDDARAEVERLDDLLRQIADDQQQTAPGGAGKDPADELFLLGDEEVPEISLDGDDIVQAEAEQETAEAMDALPTLSASRATGEGDAVEGAESDVSDLELYTGTLDPLAFLADLPETERARVESSDEDTVEQPSGADGDVEFLRDLDRALTGSDAGAEGPPLDEDPEEFRPTPGTKCPECGYTNDPEAWYCGVCGVDLA